MDWVRQNRLAMKVETEKRWAEVRRVVDVVMEDEFWAEEA